jgi:DNA-binding transcriptional regulator YiaG
MKQKYKSGAFRAIHEAATARFEIGAMSEDRMREFDCACLVLEAPHASPSVHDAAVRRSVPITAYSR